MRLVILDDYDMVSEWAAKYVRNSILKFNPGPDRYFVLGLPTGKMIITMTCRAGGNHPYSLCCRKHSVWHVQETGAVPQGRESLLPVCQDLQHG